MLYRYAGVDYLLTRGIRLLVGERRSFGVVIILVSVIVWWAVVLLATIIRFVSSMRFVRVVHVNVVGNGE